MINVFKFLKFQDRIGNPPWDYYFLQNLPEKEYPKYLAKLYKIKTGERLNLKHPRTFNEKIQWIKLYGVTSLMRDCTDKVKARDYVKKKIGEEYLKPVLQIIPNESQQSWRVIANHDSILDGEAIQRNLRKGETRVNEGIAYDSDSEVCDLPERQQIQRQEEVKQETRNENSGIKPEFQNVDCRGTQNVVVPRNDRALGFKDNDNKNNDVTTYFDEINFDKLPNSFVIKTNHGCKWQYIVKNKEEFLSNKRLFNEIKKQITGWLEQEYWLFEGFEMQYKDIAPKILIEPLMRDDINKDCEEIQVYCFSNQIPLLLRLQDNKTTLYDEKFNIIDDVLFGGDININKPADAIIKQTFDLSKQLLQNFNFPFVRIDWMIYKNLPYFEEFTFTPYSGFHLFKDNNTNLKLGNLINLERQLK